MHLGLDPFNNMGLAVQYTCVWVKKDEGMLIDDSDYTVDLGFWSGPIPITESETPLTDSHHYLIQLMKLFLTGI